MTDAKQLRDLALDEASYQRDLENRKRAERFYSDLYRYVDVDKETLRNRLTPTRDGKGFVSLAAEFSSEDPPPRLLVRFDPEKGGQKGGMGMAGNVPAIVLNVLLKPGDLSYLATRLSTIKNVVVHEMVHYLDPGRAAGRGGAHAKARGGETAYYNAPGEWNAYWQEGASDLESFLTKLGPPETRNPNVFDHFFGDGTLKGLTSRVERFWDVDFLDNMDATTRRKFDKRLAELWKQLKDSGRL